MNTNGDMTRGRTGHYVQQIRARSGKAGSVPHDSSRHAKARRISIVDYDPQNYDESETHSIDECSVYLDTPTVTWFNITGHRTGALLGDVQRVFGIDYLTLQPVVRTGQRPRVDVFDAYILITLHTFTYNDAADTVEVGHISVILGEHYVLTFSEDYNALATVKKRIQSKEERIRVTGPDYLAFEIMDAVVEEYFAVLEKLGERIESVEDTVVASATSQTLREIHALKTELIYLRESMWPLRETFERLSETDTPLIAAQTRPFFRDLYDRTVNIIDVIETFRDIISGILDTYLSNVSLKLNEVMKVLTIIGTIFLPLAFIASVYGMNFREPEVTSQWGYPAFWLVSAVIVIAMLVYFKRVGWLLAPHARGVGEVTSTTTGAVSLLQVRLFLAPVFIV